MGKSVRSTIAPETSDTTTASDISNTATDNIKYTEIEVPVKEGDKKVMKKMKVGILSKPDTLEDIDAKIKLAEDHLKEADPNNKELVDALTKGIAALNQKKVAMTLTPAAPVATTAATK